MTFAINGSCWAEYGNEALFELMESHPFLFPEYRRPAGNYDPVSTFHPVQRQDKPFIDDFGCRWETARDGLTGTVVSHPLADWEAFAAWKEKLPDPAYCSGLGPLDWEKKKAAAEEQRRRGELISEGLRHGHTFLQLCDLRGYQNLLYDFADEESRLGELIDIVERFNRGILERCLEMDPDVLGYPDDLGMQKGPLVSPGDFRKYIKPSYQRLMKLARDKSVPVHMHSDGDIRDLLEDLIDGGVDIINLQDLVNGIGFITQRLAGKTCVEVDIDRQNVTVFGTPADIDRHIREVVSSVGRKEGGLMLIYGWYPGTPLKNAAAVMDAMEKYAGYFS
jgi:hypothetical protein